MHKVHIVHNEHIVHKTLMRALVLAALFFTPMRAQVAAPHLPPLDRALPPRAERIYKELAAGADAKAAKVAMDVVNFMPRSCRATTSAPA